MRDTVCPSRVIIKIIIFAEEGTSLECGDRLKKSVTRNSPSFVVIVRSVVEDSTV